MSNMTLNDLTDVTVSNPIVDQRLIYDGSKWVNYFAKVMLSYDNFFKGKTITVTKGQYSSTITLPLNVTDYIFYVQSSGTYELSYEESGYSYTASVTVEDPGEMYYTTLFSQDTITVTLYSATGDTLVYTDADGVEKTAVFDDDSTSKVVELSIIPSGISITFESSIALDLTVGTYSKSVIVNSNTTEIYVMPEGSIYWFGWMSDDFESCITSNGWSLDGVVSSVSLEAPTYQKNAVRCRSTTNAWNGVGTKSLLNNKSKIKVIVYRVAGNNSFCGAITDKRIGWPSPTNILASVDINSAGVIMRREIDVSTFSNYYFSIYSKTDSGVLISAIVAEE